MTENTNEKNFTYQIELVNVSFSPQKGGYLKLDGKTRSGKPFYGTLFDAPAHALNKTLGAIIPPGENVSSMNLVVDITGRWIERAATKDADGKDKKGSRYFRVHEFDVLSGPRLEVARIGREAARALETSQKVVDLEAAYTVLAEFAARMGGVTFDPRASAYLQKNSSEHDAAMDENHAMVADPEDDAWRRYDDQDRTSGLTDAITDAPEIASPVAVTPSEPVVEQVAAPEREQEFSADDEMVLEGSIEGVENAPEMEAFTLEEENPLTADATANEDEEPVFRNDGETADTQDMDEEVDASLDNQEAEENKVEEPVAPVRSAPSPVPPRPTAPGRPAPPSRAPSRPVAQSAPGPRP